MKLMLGDTFLCKYYSRNVYFFSIKETRVTNSDNNYYYFSKALLTEKAYKEEKPNVFGVEVFSDYYLFNCE